jgi:hypothetical protein
LGVAVLKTHDRDCGLQQESPGRRQPLDAIEVVVRIQRPSEDFIGYLRDLVRLPRTVYVLPHHVLKFGDGTFSESQTMGRVSHVVIHLVMGPARPPHGIDRTLHMLPGLVNVGSLLRELTGEEVCYLQLVPRW